MSIENARAWLGGAFHREFKEYIETTLAGDFACALVDLFDGKDSLIADLQARLEGVESSGSADAQRLLSQLREELAQRDAEVANLQTRLTGMTFDRNCRIEERNEARKRLAALESQQAASVGGEREAFEARFGGCLSMRKNQHEQYTNGSTLAFWAGWSERAALSPAGGGVAELPEELFDGLAVYQALERRDRTGPENVSDTLNALAKLIRARLNAKPSYAPELLADIQERCLAGMGGPALEAFSALSTIHALIEKAKPQANSQEAK